MITRNHLFSVIRYLPQPVTGEFINVGAIICEPKRQIWAVRYFTQDHVRPLVDSTYNISFLYFFLDDLVETILWAPELPHEWIHDLRRAHLNLVQFSPPAPIISSDISDALDVIFYHSLNAHSYGAADCVTACSKIKREEEEQPEG